MAARTGRKPSGPQIVERLEGSPLAKDRLEVILATITGALTIPRACDQLGISETRFHDLRKEALQATLAWLEPRQSGRPRTEASLTSAEIERLLAENEQLKEELSLAEVRLELAAIRPETLALPPEPTKKKRRQQREKNRHREHRRRRKPK